MENYIGSVGKVVMTMLKPELEKRLGEDSGLEQIFVDEDAQRKMGEQEVEETREALEGYQKLQEAAAREARKAYVI